MNWKKGINRLTRIVPFLGVYFFVFLLVALTYGRMLWKVSVHSKFVTFIIVLPVVVIFSFFGVTPFILVYWFFNPDRRWSLETLFGLIVHGLPFLYLFLIMYFGIIAILLKFDVPQNWAGAVGIIFSASTIVFLLYVFSIFEKLRIENQSMKTELEIVEEKKRIKYSDASRLKEECIEYKQRLEELAKLNGENKHGLNSNQRYERYKLEELLREMKYEIHQRTLSQDNQKQ